MVFESTEADIKKLTEETENTLEKKFGWHIAVMIRSSDGLKKILQNNPYKKTDGRNLYISFLSTEPDAQLAKAFENLGTDYEQFICKGKEVYCDMVSMGQAKVIGSLEKKLQVFATNRNINTIEKLVAL